MADATNLQRYTGTPEDQSAATEMYLHGLHRIGAIGAGILPPVALGQPAGDWHNWVPGAISYLAQGAMGMGNLILNSASQSVPETERSLPFAETREAAATPPDAVSIPGTEPLGDQVRRNINAGVSVLPAYEAKTDAAKEGEHIGEGIGLGAFSVVPELAGVKYLSTALKFAGPPSKFAGPNAILGGTVGAFQPLDQADATQPAAAQPDATQPVAVQPQPATAQPQPFEELSDAGTPPKPVQMASVQPFEEIKTDAAGPQPFEEITPQAGASSKIHPDLNELSLSNDGGFGYGAAGIGILGILGASWALARGGPQGINYVADLIRGTLRDPIEANNLLASGVPRTTPIEMPLPNNAGGVTRQLAVNVLNPNAVMKQYFKAPEISATKLEADAKVAAMDMVNDPGNAARRMEGLYRTGVEEGTGHTFPKMVDYIHGIDGMTPEQIDVGSRAAWYQSELNLRNKNITVAASNGILPTAANDHTYRVSFPETSTTDLYNYVQDARKDPAVVQYMDSTKAVQAAVVDSYEARGRITAAQAAAARKDNPDFLPTIGIDGDYLHSWDGKIRTPGSGYADLPGPAHEAMLKHFDASIKAAQHKDWQLGVIEAQLAKQAANPNMARIITEVGPGDAAALDRPPNAASATRRTITIGTPEGDRTFDINSTPFYQGLGGGPMQMYIGGGIGNTIRRLVTSGTTGPLNMALGGFFAGKTFIRDLGLIPAQAPRGMWRGEFDRATGIRLPYDPTFPIGAGVTAVKDSTSVIAKNMGDILANRDNIISAPLRAALGDAKVDAMAHWVSARAEASKLAYREAQGVGAGGNRALLTSQAGTRYRNPTSDAVAPMLFKPNFKLIPDRMSLPNFPRNTINGAVRGAASTSISMSKLVRELYGTIADAPHSYLYDLNRGNPAYPGRSLSNAVQTVTGNPGTRGRGIWTQRVAGNLPFYNTGLQAVAASLASFRDNPLPLGATVGTILVMRALASHLSALLSGPAHVEHLENQLSNSVQTRNTIIYHGPGTDPNDHTELPNEAEWQGLGPYVSGLVGHLIGTWNAYKDPDLLTRLTHTIADVFGQHVETDVVRRSGIGIVNAAVPADVPPIVAAPLSAFTGQNVQNVPEQIVQNLINGQSLRTGLVSGDGSDQLHKIPGQESPDGVLNRSDMGALKAFMSALGGATGMAYDYYHNFQQRMRTDPTGEWSWSGLFQDYKQAWKDNTRYGNFLWRNTLPQSTYGAMEERTNLMWKNVAATTGLGTDIKAEGFSGVRNAVPLASVGNSPVPTDPQMQKLYSTMAVVGQGIAKEIMPRENQIRAQIDNLKQAGFGPDEWRRIGNQLSQQLYELTTMKHRRLIDLNAMLSNMAGGRHVDVGRPINWGGTVDQFHY